MELGHVGRARRDGGAAGKGLLGRRLRVPGGLRRAVRVGRLAGTARQQGGEEEGDRQGSHGTLSRTGAGRGFPGGPINKEGSGTPIKQSGGCRLAC
ncbi:Hypothetical protein AA314_04868 [Archangium gephyra]|uniref:Uncharacterized protein n=1 Tax=Archangium gephyra TaxID=48 RepID=A0AAC8TER4_9BACT|nr:Hypothetical protein AA314_04868 [Archangium gephyra]